MPTPRSGSPTPRLTQIILTCVAAAHQPNPEPQAPTADLHPEPGPKAVTATAYVPDPAQRDLMN